MPSKLHKTRPEKLEQSPQLLERAKSFVSCPGETRGVDVVSAFAIESNLQRFWAYIKNRNTTFRHKIKIELCPLLRVDDAVMYFVLS